MKQSLINENKETFSVLNRSGTQNNKLGREEFNEIIKLNDVFISN